MDRLIPENESHAADVVYAKYTEVEQFVFNYMLNSMPEFMYYQKLNNTWEYNEPLLSMLAILAKTIGASRELILNLYTSKDIGELYNKISKEILLENNKKLLYSLALELNYDITNMSDDVDEVIKMLIEQEAFVKSSLISVRHRGTIAIIKELLTQYKRYEKDYNVQYNVEEDDIEPFKVNIGVNLTDLSNKHPLYRGLMKIKPAGVIFNILSFIRELIAYNSGASNAVVRQLSYVDNLVGPPRPLSTETRRAPIITATRSGSWLNYTITHSNPQQVKAHILIEWRYMSPHEFLNYDETFVVNLPGSTDGIKSVSTNLNVQNKVASVANASIHAYLTNPSGSLQSNTTSENDVTVSAAPAPTNPIAPQLSVIAVDSDAKAVTVRVRNMDTRIIPTMQLQYGIPSMNTGWIDAQQVISLVQPGQTRDITLSNMPAGHIIYIKAIAKLNYLNSTESNLVNAYITETDDVTQAPSIISVGCLETSGSKTMTVTIKNNDSEPANISINGASFGTLGAGATKSYDYGSISQTPYGYNISAVAKAQNKAISAAATDSGTVKFCLVVVPE